MVADVPSFCESPTLWPIEVDTQEPDRKRLGKCMAASKWHKRKLERI